MDSAPETLAPGAFKHIVVPIGVVIGLGVARIVMLVSHYVAEHRRIRFSAAHAVWSLLLFVVLIGLWWIVWGLGRAPAERWSFFVMFFLMVGPVLIYLPIILLLPDLPDTGELDLGSLFDRLAPLVMRCMALFVVWLGCAELYILDEPFWQQKRINQIVLLASFVAGSFMGSRRVAGAIGAVALGVVLVALATLRSTIG